MKKRFFKTILASLIIASAVSVTGCGSDTDTRKTANESSKISEAETTTVTETEAVTEQETEPPTEAPTEPPEELWREGFRELVSNCESIQLDTMPDAEITSLDYALYDADGDELPELIFTALTNIGNGRSSVIKIYKWNFDKVYSVGEIGASVTRIGYDGNSGKLLLPGDPINGVIDYTGIDITYGRILTENVGSLNLADDTSSGDFNYTALDYVTLIGNDKSDNAESLIDNWDSGDRSYAVNTDNSLVPMDFIGMSSEDLKTALGGRVYKGFFKNGQDVNLCVYNTNVYPNYKFNAEGSVSQIEVYEGGKINDKIEVGMSYNELKELLGFEGVTQGMLNIGMNAKVTIDGKQWFIAFDLSDEEMEQITSEFNSTEEWWSHEYDLSDLNPKSCLALYKE